MKQFKSSMPRAIARRVMQRYAAGERVVVLVGKNGKPSRVFGFDEYVRRKALTREVKPWEHRKQRAAFPDPLGAVDAGVLGPITRENMYEE